MVRVFVDSGSSIKYDECEEYGVELIPLKILLEGNEYEDGKTIDIDTFYNIYLKGTEFPKTSLPNLFDLSNRVNEYLKQGDKVIIVTISSKISGEHNAIKLLFEDEENVRVLDSKMAVGGMRFLVQEINKYKDSNDLDLIEEKFNALIPRINIEAIPETLHYLHKGGRLSKLEYLAGSVLSIKPVIGFEDGKVTSLKKIRGMKSALAYLAKAVEKADPEYGINASYTYNKGNIDKLVSMISEDLQKLIYVYDNLDPVIAAHWGPNAFGFIYVDKTK